MKDHWTDLVARPKAIVSLGHVGSLFGRLETRGSDMLLTDIKEARKLARAREQPNLCFVRFSITDTLAAIKAAHFPDLTAEIAIHFVSLGPLACVYAEETEPVIYVHQLLNHQETPLTVISHICKHELLHLRMPSVKVNGKWIHHPPAFWAAEKALCLERKKAWAWIWTNLGGCLKRRPRLERIDVLRDWKDIWSLPKIGIEQCEGPGNNGEHPAPDQEDGW